MYSKVGTAKELLEKENYIFFLQNIYLRSFEVFEYYNDLLKSAESDKIPVNLEEAIILIKDIVNTYLGCDKEKNIKVTTVKRLANNVILIFLLMTNIILNISVATSYLTKNSLSKKPNHSGKCLKNL